MLVSTCSVTKVPRNRYVCIGVATYLMEHIINSWLLYVAITFILVIY